MLRALVVATTLALPSIAVAGPYVSLGIGTTGVSDSNPLPAYNLQGNGRSWRAAVGYRFAPLSITSLGTFNPSFSIEGGYNGFGVESHGYPYSADALFAAGKVNVPLGHGLEAYARVGVQHSAFNINNGQTQFDNGNGSWSGTGWLGGVGLEFRLSGITGMIPFLANSSVWADWTYNDATMTDATNQQRDIPTDMLTIGLTVGF
jgi:opacity protein-like surface antigen